MSGWTVPLSSSPQAPSTPSSGQRPISDPRKPQNGILKSPFPANPSTTPAGPPPSSVGSFTPAGPPPSSIFGSSQIGSGKTLFKSKGSFLAQSGLRRSATPISSNSIDQNKLARYLDKSGDFDFGSSNGVPVKNQFGVPSSSPPQDPSNDEEDASYEDESEGFEDDANDEVSEEVEDVSEEEGVTNMGIGLDSHRLDLGSAISSSPNGLSVNGKPEALGSSILDASPRGVKRSRGGLNISSTWSRDSGPLKAREQSAVPSIIKSMVSQRGVTRLEERDDFILGTEDIIQEELYGAEVLGERHGEALITGLPKACQRLSSFWRSCSDQDLARLHPRQDFYKGIGPDESAPPMHKATFLGSLLLQLHHPPPAKGKQALALTPLNRSSIRSKPSQAQYSPSIPTAFPKLLTDWLNSSHDPYELFNKDVQRFQPNPTAHFNYWDILFSLTLRGKLADVVHLLKRSDFHFARTAKDDRKDGDGYSGIQIQNIERVVNRAIQILEHCPILQDDDWHVTGNEWIMFRKRIEQAITDLATFAEGHHNEKDPTESTLEASHFGLRNTSMSLSQSARKAESQVPWTIYQNLKAIYGILLGGTTEILAMAQDWVEATIGLTVWWVGDDDEDIAVGSVALSRHSLRKSEARGPRLVDVNPNAAYLRRLMFAFESVDIESSAEKGLAINTLNPIEVGLASVFEHNVEGVIGLLRTWSLPVASAVAEIASAGGWFEIQASGNIMQGLDNSDLMLLSAPMPSEPPMTKDAILSQYAAALSNRGKILKIKGDIVHEGWEIAISVLTRLDDEAEAAKQVGELLQRLPRDSDVQVDRILRTCERFSITKEARDIAESYADHLVDTTDHYGTALIYYARAHCQKKVKDVLDLLISLCLVQSTTYPAPANLDPNLHALINEPNTSLGQLALLDRKAAEMLRTSLTGYATLRRFYDLRDEEVRLEEGQKSTMGPIARKNAAAVALVAVINSAADSIHGGLYDESRGAIVQVDGLLALLGEAMMFVNQPGFLLSLAHCFSLLKAIEDLQAVTPRIYAQCEECFHSTLAARHGRAAPEPPRELLKKSMSSITSSFSLVGHSMVQSTESNGTDFSRALAEPQEEVKRGWDWRDRLGEKAKGEDVLRILRMGLARDIAKHWMAGE